MSTTALPIFDESADIFALAEIPIVLVSSGAKAILDIRATLERFESLSIPVVGYRTNTYPGFYVAESEYALTARVDDPADVATMVTAQKGLGVRSAVLVANPVPVDQQLDPTELNAVLQRAWAAADEQGISGQASTRSCSTTSGWPPTDVASTRTSPTTTTTSGWPCGSPPSWRGRDARSHRRRRPGRGPWQLEEVREATDTKSEVRMRRGGSAANVAAFAGPRYPTRFIGCVGDDLAGVAVTRELEERGVQVRMQVRDNTGMIVVLIDRKGERVMFPSRAACTQLEALDPAWLDDLEILHVTAYSFEGGTTAQNRARRGSRAQGARRPGLDRRASVGMIDHFGIEAFLNLMADCQPDFISANQDEARYLGLADGPVPGPNLARYGDAILLARQGQQPTNLFRAGQHLAAVPVTPVEVVLDLTGAGDASMQAS